MGLEFLFVIVGLCLLAVPILIIVLFVGQSNLSGRLKAAENQITILQAKLKKSEAVQGPKEPSPKSTKTASDPVKTAAPTEAVAPSSAPKPAKTEPPKLPPKTPAAPPPDRPQPVADAFARLGPWLMENWFYAISALSLALAGIFLVQYGMENGLLPPAARVAAALVFGAALIGAGELIRRRYGDEEGVATAYLPSVFSGAGLVTLFSGVLSARMLYELIGPNSAMIGMVVVALLGMALGWIYGPLMAAIGVVGAFGAPIVLGSSDLDASPLYGYFFIITLLGLGIDTIRRWAWVSALTMVLAYLVGVGLLASPGPMIQVSSVFYFVALAVAAIAIPARSILSPDHTGETIALSVQSRVQLSSKPRGWPSFPTVLAFACVAATAFLLFSKFDEHETVIWLSMLALAGLTMLLIFWSRKAPALQDQMALPAIGLLGSIIMQGQVYARTIHSFHGAKDSDLAMPYIATVLVSLGVFVSLAAAWRSGLDGRLRALWAAMAAVYAPAVAILLEVYWYEPAEALGRYPWALHAVALAVLMVFLAERFARRDGEDRLRVALFTMSALSCLSFAFVLIFSSAALTVALAVTVLTAALLDRLFNLKPMGWFIAIGIVVLGYRLAVDPGLEYGRFGPTGGMLLAYGGTFAAFAAALWALKGRPRATVQVMLDSALWSTGGMLISLLLLRAIDGATDYNGAFSHWAQGLMGTIWLGLSLAQVQRLSLGGRLRLVRLALAGVFALIGFVAMMFPLLLSNPLFNYGDDARVLGAVVFNTLAPAYLVPGLLLLAAGWRLTTLPQKQRMALFVMGGGLVVFWLITVIRHFWVGANDMYLLRGFSQGELYTYTVALLMTGGALFYQSLARGSAMMRKAGLVVIGIAVAKVFFVDISGLEGLMRVFSLLVLGLSLAGLAWLNRWAQDRYAETSNDS